MKTNGSSAIHIFIQQKSWDYQWKKLLTTFYCSIIIMKILLFVYLYFIKISNKYSCGAES